MTDLYANERENSHSTFSTFIQTHDQNKYIHIWN